MMTMMICPLKLKNTHIYPNKAYKNKEGLQDISSLFFAKENLFHSFSPMIEVFSLSPFFLRK
jgi:hypothetical protein